MQLGVAEERSRGRLAQVVGERNTGRGGHSEHGVVLNSSADGGVEPAGDSALGVGGIAVIVAREGGAVFVFVTGAEGGGPIADNGVVGFGISRAARCIEVGSEGAVV